MSSGNVRVVHPIWSSRYAPPEAMAMQAQMFQESGVVDDALIWDQLLGIHPLDMWSEQKSQQVIPDYDSFPDPYVLAGYLANVAPGLGLTVTGDTIREGPAERMRAMLTLADFTNAKTTFLFGAGEIKQCTPFGWKRSKGLLQMEDHFRIYRKFLESDGPISFEGNVWNFDDAWIGGAKANTPKFWGMGGGPKLFDLATSYADGISTLIPGVWSTPDKTAANVATLRNELATRDRDPAEFDIAAWVLTIMHDEGATNDVDRALDSPLLKWLAVVWGRMNQRDWEAEGFESPQPANWHYGLNFNPMKSTWADLEPIIAKVSRKMMEKSFLIGTPEDVAAQLQPHIDAGVTAVIPCDTLQMVGSPEDAPRAMERAIEFCRALKAGGS